MKIGILLSSPGISGGVNVVFEHASKLVDKGENVYIITEEEIKPAQYSWHEKAKKFKWVTFNDVDGVEFDIVIATWWRTVYELYRLKSKQYIYFVQSIESRFYSEEEDGIKMLADLTYCVGLKIITEATWIKNYLESMYGLDVLLVKNGINKEIFKLKGDTYDECNGLRVLVEGSLESDFKNVPKTIELVKKSKAKEIYLLTPTNIDSYEGVDKVFSCIPIKDCAKIYRSCDLIVKLSYIEGMFGPPLEEFHCGGTCVVYDVSGYDEYIVDDYNGLVVKTDDENKVIEYINKLADSSEELNRLKNNAIKTANKWPSWDEASTNFYNAIVKISKTKSIGRDAVENKSKMFMNIYEQYEAKKEEIRSIPRYVPLKTQLKNKVKSVFGVKKD